MQGLIRAVTLDFDGTLVDHDSAIALALAAVGEAATAHDANFPIVPFCHAFDRAGRELKEQADAAGVPGWLVHEQVREALSAVAYPDAEELALRLAPVFERSMAHTAIPFAETAEALSGLSKIPGVRIGILSNGDGDIQRTRIELSGFADAVDAVIVSGTLGVSKPDRRCFEIAAEHLGVLVEELVHVGDDPLHDVAGAKSAGARAIWIRPRAGAARPDPEPDGEAADLREAVQLIRDEVLGRTGGPGPNRSDPLRWTIDRSGP